MTAGFSALIFGVGIAAWVYNKMTRRTGTSNATPALVVAGVAGVVAFIIFFTAIHTFLK